MKRNIQWLIMVYGVYLATRHSVKDTPQKAGRSSGRFFLFFVTHNLVFCGFRVFNFVVGTCVRVWQRGAVGCLTVWLDATSTREFIVVLMPVLIRVCPGHHLFLINLHAFAFRYVFSSEVQKAQPRPQYLIVGADVETFLPVFPRHGIDLGSGSFPVF